MGLLSGFSLTFQPHSYSINDFLQVLIDTGWNYSREGFISVLPLGDTDYAWEWVAESEWETILSVLYEKWFYKEVIGLEMFWQDSERSIVFHFHPDNTLSCTIGNDRVIIEDARSSENQSYRFTDFSWYLTKVLHSVMQLDDLLVESVECHDI